ncbi:hypothetical protein [Pseudochelatococcus contaminans]|uniref:Uncharacterized protein n=1 Tax=Pseudochelatococcus contaminans TaxID=1538103 RepID=A0A7W5Z606_9HYPH|nr:hypothetical protein [Pseudochelatococcus contaminans]MBB3810106.1 hypothetical protein [Pseudochelatococcus contaminans]
MSNQLDQKSRATVGRFGLKLVISVILGSFSEVGRTVGPDGWLALSALLSAAIALFKRDRFPTRGFNYWDEALWLVAASAGLHVLLREFA